MLRKVAGAVLALLLAVGVMVAAEIKGKVKEASEDKIVVTVDGKDHTIAITADTKIVNDKGREVKDREKAIRNFKGLAKRNAEVTVQCEDKDGKKVATEIKLPAGKKKDN
jgi:hypothetical protein